MNPESILNEVAKAINNRKPTISNRYHITIQGDEFLCISTSEPFIQSRVVGTFTNDELTTGLTYKQWSKLSAKIAEYYRMEAKK